MCHVGEETQPCLFPVMRNGHGGAPEPKGDQFSGCNLGMIPKENQLLRLTKLYHVGSNWENFFLSP